MAAQRVLHIISSTMRAGVAVMVMNLYRETDRGKLQFDFVAHELGSRDFDAEIASLGGRVFRVPFLSEAGIPGFVRLIREIIRNNGPYAAIHAHTDYQTGFCALAARQAGVPIRICHAHSDTRDIHSPVFMLKKQLGRMLINRYATQRCACSRNAGLSTFGRRAADSGKVAVIPNGIDLSGFADYPPQLKTDLRRDCQADGDTRIIGCVGRLSPEKNPSFVLDMAAQAKKAGLDFRFVFAGAGVMMDNLVSRRKQMDLEDTVFFLGVRDDIPHLMQCLDMVVVPSFSEGFSLSALEAQAAGTSVLVTPCVPDEADMGLGLFHPLPLDAGAAAWVERANDIIGTDSHPDAATRIERIQTRGYDAKRNARSLLRLYGIVQES